MSLRSPEVEIHAVGWPAILLLVLVILVAFAAARDVLSLALRGVTGM